MASRASPINGGRVYLDLHVQQAKIHGESELRLYHSRCGGTPLGLFRAKMAQEDLIKASKVPYTILRSTQFFEFLNSIVQSATDGPTVRLSPALVQPVVSDDVSLLRWPTSHSGHQ